MEVTASGLSLGEKERPASSATLNATRLQTRTISRLHVVGAKLTANCSMIGPSRRRRQRYLLRFLVISCRFLWSETVRLLGDRLTRDSRRKRRPNAVAKDPGRQAGGLLELSTESTGVTEPRDACDLLHREQGMS